MAQKTAEKTPKMCLPVLRNIERNFMGFVESRGRTISTRQGEVIWLKERL